MDNLDQIRDELTGIRTFHETFDGPRDRNRYEETTGRLVKSIELLVDEIEHLSRPSE